MGEFIVGWRDMHHVIDVLYDRSSEEETQARQRLLQRTAGRVRKARLCRVPGEHCFPGACGTELRPVKRKLEQTLKRALDPNGILAPGKCGIDI